MTTRWQPSPIFGSRRGDVCSAVSATARAAIDPLPAAAMTQLLQLGPTILQAGEQRRTQQQGAWHSMRTNREADKGHCLGISVAADRQVYGIVEDLLSLAMASM